MAWRAEAEGVPRGLVEIARVEGAGARRARERTLGSPVRGCRRRTCRPYETALVYPGGCLIEGTNLSEGRGTTRPFEIVGAPFLDGEALARDLLRATGLPGFTARPLTFLPMFQKHAKSASAAAFRFDVGDPRETFRPYATYLALVADRRARLGGDAFAFRTERYEFIDDVPAFDLLTGNAEARTRILIAR